MADFRVPYGSTTLTFSLPDERQVEWIAPVRVPPAPDPGQLVTEALDKPVGGRQLANYAGAGSVALVISDKTRPLPHAVLPPLLSKLESMGLPPDAITFLIATGTHAPMTPDEFTKVLPDNLIARYRIISHDCDNSADLVYRGQTQRGTPVCVNRHFAAADLRIVIGNLEPHQFMGFSGGVKSAAIGLAGRETINHNHAMMRDPLARLGRYEDNPTRQDVEEIGRLIGVDLALNTILNGDKQIVRVIAGEPGAVMVAGIPVVREFFEVGVSAPFDLVIASPGGHPKDINVYQAQKALAHATLITRPGGTVILVAACPEGAGSTSYETWIAGMPSHQAVLERFADEEFRLGPHKAYLIARDAARVRLLVLSDMEPAYAERLLLTPVNSVEQALVLSDLVPDARIGVMPAANATIPYVRAHERARVHRGYQEG
jgi:nickel-dependent lactate racemase